MKLSVIVPVYNESRTVGRVLEEILKQPLPVPMEVLVVDDGSTDGTDRALSSLQDPRIRVIRHEHNRGKGASIRTGLEAAAGEIVLIQDADLEYDPADYPRLLEPILREEAQVVYGSRIRKKDNPRSYWRYYWGGRILSWWTNLLYGSSITDEPTGYKVFRTNLLKSLDLQCAGFEFCPEATGKVLRRGISIVEVPISYRPRSIEEGKKIRWKDGAIALWTLLKYRFE